MKEKLSHIEKDGNPGMVDVSSKSPTSRSATAIALIKVGEEIMVKLKEANFNTHKGSIIQTSIIAGSMGAKKTADMIPFCHTLPLESCKIQIEPINEESFEVRCAVSTHSKTGVEMEALMGANIAALTFYDMIKSLSHDIEITLIHLIKKSGGKSDYTR